MRELCKKGHVNIPALNLRIPSIGFLNDIGDGTPSASSVTSAVSEASTTSSLHIDRLTMDSPSPQLMGPPIAGPSGLGRNQLEQQGTCSTNATSFGT